MSGKTINSDSLYINALIVDTENAIRQLEPKLQNVYRHLAATQIKHIMTTNRYNVLHKRQQYNINQLKKILKNNNLITIKADKTKAIVIINKESLKMKVNNLITENHMQQLYFEMHGATIKISIVSR